MRPLKFCRELQGKPEAFHRQMVWRLRLRDLALCWQMAWPPSPGRAGRWGRDWRKRIWRADLGDLEALQRLVQAME